ncbi:MAG: 4Fe-4S binding protein [Desulfurococcaceae archaeon]|nr:4Fe-4S binding protein [Desulfurococcaceae archaeon]MCC6053010.1 4Fe-4S binding protein [Desulfurococcaceae archaeon]
MGTNQSNVKVEVDTGKCTLCKLCVLYCPTYVFSIVNGRVVADSTKCIECYGCIPLCPSNAIRVEVFNSKV